MNKSGHSDIIEGRSCSKPAGVSHEITKRQDAICSSFWRDCFKLNGLLGRFGVIVFSFKFLFRRIVFINRVFDRNFSLNECFIFLFQFFLSFNRHQFFEQWDLKFFLFELEHFF